MDNKRSKFKTIIYNAPDGGELRRIRCRDGISFVTAILPEGASDKRPVSIAVELQLTSSAWRRADHHAPDSPPAQQLVLQHVVNPPAAPGCR